MSPSAVSLGVHPVKINQHQPHLYFQVLAHRVLKYVETGREDEPVIADLRITLAFKTVLFNSRSPTRIAPHFRIPDFAANELFNKRSNTYLYTSRERSTT